MSDRINRLGMFSRYLRSSQNRRLGRLEMLDMSALVIIPCLLLVLTFFAVSSAFELKEKPHVLEVKIPSIKSPNTCELWPMGSMLTIRVDSEGRFWWNKRVPTPDNLPKLLPSELISYGTASYKLDPDTLYGLLTAQYKADSRLFFSLVIHPDATYEDMVGILDGINRLELTVNATSANRINRPERSVNTTSADRMGIIIEWVPQFEKRTFSYSFGDWQERDNKIMTAALAAIQ